MTSHHRLAVWWSTWRVSVRLARRELLRHRGRSLLIAGMVGLPVVALVAGVTLWSTNDIQPAEGIPYLLGQSQARITKASDQAIDQDAYGALLLAPGKPPLQPGTASVEVLEHLVGSGVSTIRDARLRVRVGGRVIGASALGVNAAAPVAEGMVHLVSGRWAAAPGEVVTTRTGLSKGLPDSGTVTVLRGDGTTETYTVVGVGDGYGASPLGTVSQAVDLVTLPDSVLSASAAPGSGPGEASYAAYLVDRPTPVSWDEVRRFNQSGFVVLSRSVIENPPPGSTDRYVTTDGRAQLVGVTGMLAVAMLVLTTLLAGPAFAVSASRQRRVLALAASNGATTAQLRRTVLGQALVLGVASALAGMVAGLGAAVVGRWVANAIWPWRLFGPYDIPWWSVLLVAGGAVVSSVVAAVVPARGLGRLDVISTLRGGVVSRPLRRRTPWAGVVLLALGSAMTLYAGWQEGVLGGDARGWLMTFGSVMVVVGALFLVPMLLVALSRASGRAPFWVRMATREFGRLRGRSTATVAAILGGAAVLSAVLIASASGEQYNERHYRPSLPMGTGLVSIGYPGPVSVSGSTGRPDPVPRVRDVAAQVAPGLVVVELRRAGFPDERTGGTGNALTGPVTSRMLSAARSGCSSQAIAAAAAGTDLDDPCLSIGAGGGIRPGIAVVPTAELLRRLPLDPVQAAAVRAGAIVVPRTDPSAPALTAGGWPTAPVDVVNDQVTFVTMSQTHDAGTPPAGTWVEERRQEVPAVVMPWATIQTAFPQGGTAAAMSTDAAAALAWPTVSLDITLHDPNGPISEADQQQLEQGLQAQFADAIVFVERGYRSPSLYIVLGGILIVGFVILVATLISTVLSQVEASPLMGTLAAVGATRGTRRRWAAASAGLLSALGVVVGVVVGAVPGLALAITFTNHDSTSGTYEWVPPTLVVPWLPLLAVVVAVPALAAVISWLAVHRAPTVTRRLG